MSRTNEVTRELHAELVFNGQCFGVVLEADAIWNRGYPGSRIDPPEPAGHEVESVRCKYHRQLAAAMNKFLREEETEQGAWDLDVELYIDRDVIDTTIGGMLNAKGLEVDWAQLDCDRLREKAGELLDDMLEGDDL